MFDCYVISMENLHTGKTMIFGTCFHTLDGAIDFVKRQGANEKVKGNQYVWVNEFGEKFTIEELGFGD